METAAAGAVTVGAVAGGPAPDMWWTSWEHGQQVVERGACGWKLCTPGRPALAFTSGRALMRAVHGGRDPHLTPERYFRTGPYSEPGPREPAAATTLELFGPSSCHDKLEFVGAVPMGRARRRHRISRPPAPARRRMAGTGALHLVLAPSLPPSPKLGINLALKHLDVRRLLFAGFGKRIVAMGYEPEDVLQDVYRGLLARNRGRCPWDARKSSFGHYVHMVCSCILSNYHRSKMRVRSREGTGVPTLVDGVRMIVDVAEADLAWVPADQDHGLIRLDLVADVEGELIRNVEEPGLALAVLPHMLAGRNRREISRKVGVREGLVAVAVEEVRTAVRVSRPVLSAAWG